MKALLPASLKKVSSRADRSYDLTFTTRELAGEEASFLLGQLQTEGWLLYSANDDIENADVPDEKADAMVGQKTQAQRLRAVIYVLWEQRGSKGNFEEYYRTYLEGIIEQVKAKLEEK